MKTVSIVLVNWNGKEYTLKSLESLTKMRNIPYSVRIIVVDNASEDGSATAIRKRFPHVTVVTLTTNQGFSGGNNAGIRLAMQMDSEYIWLLNNDTITHPSSLAGLLAAFDNPRVGIAGSKIYFAPGREYHKTRYTESQKGKVLWYAGGQVDWANMYASHRGVDEVDRGQYDKTEDTEFVTGCSMCISKDVVNKIGFLDDRYFLYLEDLDYCLRAKAAGFRIVYVPASIVWHENAGSTAKPGNPLHQYYLTRNRLLLGGTYAPIRTKIALMREGFKFILSGSPPQRKAVTDYLFCRFGGRFAWK